MDLALFQAFDFYPLALCWWKCFVAKAVGAENLPAVGGIYHLDPQRQFCRVSSSQLATY